MPTITFDVWFSRDWGRLTGQLLGRSEEAQAAQTRRFVEALRRSGIPVPKDPERLRALADDLMAKHEADYKVNQADYKSGAKEKSDVTRTAERLIKGQDGLRDVPSSGGQRTWMRSVVARTRAILAEQGLRLTNADLQALLWYPEKDLYGKMGGKASTGLNVDYAQAWAQLAKQKGFSDDDIAEALRTLGGRPRSAAAVGEGGEGTLPPGPGRIQGAPSAGAPSERVPAGGGSGGELGLAAAQREAAQAAKATAGGYADRKLEGLPDQAVPLGDTGRYCHPQVIACRRHQGFDGCGSGGGVLTDYRVWIARDRAHRVAVERPRPAGA